jgi:hypothetical protein
MDICHAYARVLPQSDFKRFACVGGDELRVWGSESVSVSIGDGGGCESPWLRGDDGPHIFQIKSKISFTGSSFHFGSVDLFPER